MLQFIYLAILSLNVPHPYIINGVPAQINDYISAVSIQVSPTQHFCGGVLSSGNYVITAAHCFDNIELSGVEIEAGTTSLDSSGAIVTGIDKVFINADYNNKNFANDIAVVKINKNINLQYATFLNENPSVGTQFTAVGWGVTSYQGSTSDILLSTPMITTDYDSCLAANVGTVVCAKSVSETSSPCSGDSGGGLFTQNNEVAGVLAYGQLGCPLDQPSGYTNTFSYKNFVCCYTSNTAEFKDSFCNVSLATCATEFPAIILEPYTDLIILIPIILGAIALCCGILAAVHMRKQYSRS